MENPTSSRRASRPSITAPACARPELPIFCVGSSPQRHRAQIARQASSRTAMRNSSSCSVRWVSPLGLRLLRSDLELCDEGRCAVRQPRRRPRRRAHHHPRLALTAAGTSPSSRTTTCWSSTDMTNYCDALVKSVLRVKKCLAAVVTGYMYTDGHALPPRGHREGQGPSRNSRFSPCPVTTSRTRFLTSPATSRKARW